ncbi:hypothetical protein [Lacibacter sp. H407]|uniref:hypothetical protein n=1 Tax=Lacibacter sp. H407 TaxID=3133423 RepID=UPI0030BD94F8
MSFTQKWSRWALFNFVVLALVGVLLRYKILYPLPLVDHKHLLHAHSHFAFAGWVTLALFVCIISVLKPTIQQQHQFNPILQSQQVSSYGMLLSFPFMGYAPISIAFSTLSILVSFWFVIVAWKIIRTSTHLSIEKKWIYAALLCNVVSAAGTFTLAYLMATKTVQQNWYFGSVYFYLHFQYNGWFLFTIFALFFNQVKQWMNASLIRSSHYFFIALVVSLIPAWFLSMMWMRLPQWMFTAGTAAAFVQLIGLVIFIRLFLQLKNQLSQHLHRFVNWIWLFSASAFTLKIILQAFSAIPELNKFAFGIRPIIIGFLHLVLLGFVSLFILGYLIQHKLLVLQNKTAAIGLWLFISAMILNEVLLMGQGITAISYSHFPYGNELLLGAAVIMFSGLLLFYNTQKANKPQVARR